MFCGIDLHAFRSIIKKKELTKQLFRRDGVFCEKNPRKSVQGFKALVKKKPGMAIS